jgi:hypothetical protein
VDFAAGMFSYIVAGRFAENNRKAERLLSVELLGAVSGGWDVFLSGCLVVDNRCLLWNCPDAYATVKPKLVLLCI